MRPGNPPDEDARTNRLAGRPAVGLLQEEDEAGAQAEPARAEENRLDGAATHEEAGF